MNLINTGLPQLVHLEYRTSNIDNTIQIALITIINSPRTFANKQIVWISSSNFKATKTPQQHNN